MTLEKRLGLFVGKWLVVSGDDVIAASPEKVAALTKARAQKVTPDFLVFVEETRLKTTERAR